MNAIDRIRKKYGNLSPGTDNTDKSPSVGSVSASHKESEKFAVLERRRTYVIRELQEHPELRISTHVSNAPLRPESGAPVSVVVAIRTATAGIVSAEFSVPRERFDLALFTEMLEQTSRSPS